MSVVYGTVFKVDNFNNYEVVLRYANENNISMAIIGPENPLQEGVSDKLWSSGIPVVGPKKNLAQIETSKTFTRNLLKNLSKNYDNFIYRVTLKDLPKNIDAFFGDSGLFFEYHINNLDNINHILTDRYQTLTYSGVEKKILLEFLKLKGVR